MGDAGFSRHKNNLGNGLGLAVTLILGGCGLNTLHMEMPSFSVARVHILSSAPVPTVTPSPTPSNLGISPDTLSFGMVVAGSASSATTFTFTNSGSDDFTGCSVALSDSTDFSFTGDCSTISASSTCTVDVTASPQSVGIFRTSISVGCAGGVMKSSSGNGILVYTGGVFRYPATTVEMLIGQATTPLTPFDVNSGQSGYPFTLSASPALPAGISFDSNTGKFSGTPTTSSSGTYQVCSGSVATCQMVTLKVLNETVIPGPLTVNAALCSSVLGTGTSADPIVLNTVGDVDSCVRNYPGRAFQLNAELDFSSVVFEPLPAFTGIFDGQNHTISNWTYNEVSAGTYGSYGFFQVLDHGSVVKNLKMNNISVTNQAEDSAGALAGALSGGIIHDITLSNISISAGSVVGALVGMISAPASSPSYNGYVDLIQASNITITSNSGWSHSGFVVGLTTQVPFRISRVHVTGTNAFTTNGNDMAGIIGGNYAWEWPQLNGNVWIDQCSAINASLNSGAFAGGIIGHAEGGDVITNSFNNLVMSGAYGQGGFIGWAADNGNLDPIFIVNSYFSGATTGSDAAAILGVGAYHAFSGGLVLVNTRVLDSVTTTLVGDTGTSVVSSSNLFISDAQFKDPTNFSSWTSPPWSFSAGSYPTLP